MLILIQTAESPTVLQNLFMFAPNAWGFIVAIWLSMAAVKLQYSVATQKTEAPAPHEKLVIGCKLLSDLEHRQFSYPHSRIPLPCDSCCFVAGGSVFVIIPTS
jgi:hypothetical protein